MTHSPRKPALKTSRWRHTWALLLVSYITGIQLIAIFFTGTPALSGQTLLEVALIPVLQAAALSLAGKPPSFFVTWCVCALMQLVVPTVAGVIVFRNLPLTVDVFVSLLFVPLGQAAALTLSTATVRNFIAAAGQTSKAPLARPVLWIDGIVLTAGLLWLNHPVIGMAAAGVVQRRWMATKLMAAAIVFLFAVMRPGGQPPAATGRTVRVVAALALALIALNEFRPWMLNAGRHLPPPLNAQPLVLLWLEVYAISLVTVLVLIRACARSLRSSAPASAAVLEGAAVAIFVAALALFVNGFLTLQPVAPWAGLALGFGTLGSTLLAAGAIAASPRM